MVAWWFEEGGFQNGEVVGVFGGNQKGLLWEVLGRGYLGGLVWFKGCK